MNCAGGDGSAIVLRLGFGNGIVLQLKLGGDVELVLQVRIRRKYGI